MTQRIFLTGATGFIGSHLIQHLLTAGHDLTVLLRKTSRKSMPSGVTIVSGDICDPSTYHNALKGHDAVFHLAADYRIGPVNRHVMYSTNVLGTRDFIDTAIAEGIPRIIYVSSTAALGETHGKEENEQYQHNGIFRSYYEETKHIAHGLTAQRQRNGAPIIMAIPGGVFGEGDKSITAETIHKFCQGKVPIQIACKNRFQLCHVSHVCDGLLRILGQGQIGENYLLTGRNLSMSELFTLLAQHTGQPVPRLVSAKKLRPIALVCDVLAKFGLPMPLSREALKIMDDSTYTYNSDKACSHLGWQSGDFEADLARYLQNCGLMKSS